MYSPLLSHPTHKTKNPTSIRLSIHHCTMWYRSPFVCGLGVVGWFREFRLVAPCLQNLPRLSSVDQSWRIAGEVWFVVKRVPMQDRIFLWGFHICEIFSNWFKFLLIFLWFEFPIKSLIWLCGWWWNTQLDGESYFAVSKIMDVIYGRSPWAACCEGV